MKITIKHNDSGLDTNDKKMYNDFIKFLSKHYPVNQDLTILFLGDKMGQMSTGSQSMDGILKILSKNRLNRDIMRTLAHEWVHAHQRFVLGRERGPDIGGQNEDEANAFAGRLIKMFEKEYPNYNQLVFECSEKIIDKINIISEQILLTEKENIKEEFIMEMKKIGIEKLPYSYSALKQFVDPKTMDIHYNKHYKGYVKKLNDALSEKKHKDLELEDIIKSISKFDEKVRNNAGGAFNHALFWKMLSPTKQIPKGDVLEKITKQYGNIKKLKDEFNQVAKDRFGSGWVWLVLTKTNRLKVMSTPNQDNPLMNIVKDGGYPLLGLDVWEHAYYLKYQNKRDEYIKNFWNCVNWEFVNDLYVSKTKKTDNKKPLNESISLKEKLLGLIKKVGFESTVKVVGSLDKTFEIFGVKEPMDFLNLFNDLESVQSEEQEHWTLYRFKKGHNFMVYDRKNDYVYFDYEEIWSVLEDKFELKRTEIKELTKIWLDLVYNLKGVATIFFFKKEFHSKLN
jgi:Fe-Mn family superoxide dismutase